MEEIFLPLPYDLLASLSECRAAIESFLAKMGTLFVNTQECTNALGKGLLFAQKLIAPIGGKIIVLQSTLPNVDDGALKPREDPKLLGTPKESQLLQTASPFYKNFAIECSKSHVCVDMFLFNSQYIDIATLSKFL
jgi:protein transport protein SEC24